MSTRQPRRPAIDVEAAVGVPALALAFSVVVTLGGIAQYTRDNAEHCGGGLGRIEPGLNLYFMLALTVLVTLVALVLTLLVAIAGRRWIWLVGQVAATASSVVLLTVGADSPVSRTLVGSVLGFGCATSYPEVVRGCAPLLVAMPCLIYLLTERPQE